MNSFCISIHSLGADNFTALEAFRIDFSSLFEPLLISRSGTYHPLSEIAPAWTSKTCLQSCFPQIFSIISRLESSSNANCYFLLKTFLTVAHSSPQKAQTPSSDSPSKTSSSSSFSYLSSTTWHGWFLAPNQWWSPAPDVLLTLLFWPNWPPPLGSSKSVVFTPSGSGLGWTAVSPSSQVCWAKHSSVALPGYPWLLQLLDLSDSI